MEKKIKIIKTALQEQITLNYIIKRMQQNYAKTFGFYFEKYMLGLILSYTHPN